MYVCMYVCIVRSVNRHVTQLETQSSTIDVSIHFTYWSWGVGDMLTLLPRL